MINIDTVHENTKNNNNDIGYEITENNNNEIIKTQQLQVTREKSDTETEDMKHQVPETRRVVQGSQAKNDKNDSNLTPTDTIQIGGNSDTKIDDREIIQPVPKTRRIVQKTMLKEVAKSTPTDTIGSLRENIGIQPNIQNIDTRLLLGSDNILTAEAFLTVICDYNSLNESPSNEVCAYIINSIECRYKTKRAYQNDVRARKNNQKISITANDLTGFRLLPQYWGRILGSFFTGVYLPQKSVLSPPIERQYKPFQKHVSSY
jgi:hypothetical protein